MVIIISVIIMSIVMASIVTMFLSIVLCDWGSYETLSDIVSKTALEGPT